MGDDDLDLKHQLEDAPDPEPLQFDLGVSHGPTRLGINFQTDPTKVAEVLAESQEPVGAAVGVVAALKDVVSRYRDRERERKRDKAERPTPGGSAPQVKPPIYTYRHKRGRGGQEFPRN